MTKTIAELLAGADMEGGELFGDCIYNFLKNKDRAQNILTNSQFGVWSQSDTNKGIGVVKFDAGGAGAPVVGEVITGAAAGAKAKVIRVFLSGGTWAGNDAEGYIILGACGIATNTTRFSENEVLTYAAGTLTVNSPDATVQLSVAAATIAFNDADPDTITDTGAGFAGFAAGDVIEVSGSLSNDGFYWVAAAVVGTLTLHANETLTAEALGATVTITRRGQGDWIRNGGFPTVTTGWTAENGAVLSSDAGPGQVGNCLKVLDGGVANPQAMQEITVVPGKIYKFSFYHKDIDGTGDDPQWQVYDQTNAADIKAWTTETANAAWTAVTYVFEAPALCTAVRVYLRHTAAGGDADAYYFDEVSVYEITPCCTVGDNKAFDTWQKDSTIDIYREHSGSNTKDGSFYALKLVPSVVEDFVIYPDLTSRNFAEWMQKFAGRPVALGAWVKTSTASHFRLNIYDGSDHFSSYHTGGGAWEWLETSATISATPTYLQLDFKCFAAPAVNGDTIVYLSQPMFVFAPYIGEGNYQPRQQEWIFTEVPIPSNVYDGLTLQSDLAYTDVNLEADSDARIGKGMKAILVHTGLKDSGSGAAAEAGIYLRNDATFATMSYANSLAGKTNDIEQHVKGEQALDANGDFDIRFDATAANTLDIDMFEYHGVLVN